MRYGEGGGYFDVAMMTASRIIDRADRVGISSGDVTDRSDSTAFGSRKEHTVRIAQLHRRRQKREACVPWGFLSHRQVAHDSAVRSVLSRCAVVFFPLPLA